MSKKSEELSRKYFIVYLGTETSGSGDTMQVGVGVLGHVVVEDDVDTLDVHATTEQVGGDQDSLKIKSHRYFT